MGCVVYGNISLFLFIILISYWEICNTFSTSEYGKCLSSFINFLLYHVQIPISFVLNVSVVEAGV
jgi:hypothetical protein